MGARALTVVPVDVPVATTWPGATGAQGAQLLKNTPPHLSHVLFASLKLTGLSARPPGIRPHRAFFSSSFFDANYRFV